MMARLLSSSIVFAPMLLLTMAWDSRLNLHLPREHNVMRRSADTHYTNILKFWKEHNNEINLHSVDKDVVLVMGNTGAGKSTLISAITGRKLRAIKKNGYLVIVDEEGRIGTEVSSKTLIPEAMRDEKRNVTYIDCPGFRDNRNIEYEISTIYFQNILMNQVKKIKLLLVINYSSLKNNGNKNDFDDLFEHIGEFIKDISKFQDGIALVATKVVNIYEDLDDGTLVLANPNKLVLEGIADYLEQKKEIYRNKTENAEKYKMYVMLIDVLLQKKNNSYTRIAIFRAPNSQGLLKNNAKTQKILKDITEMIVKNLLYVKKNQDDFGFALSKSSKNTVEQIVDDIFRNDLTNRLHEMGNDTLTHFLQIEKQYSDIDILRKRISQAHSIISGITKVNEPLALFKEFLNATNTLNVPVSLTNLNIISENIKSLRFFTTVLNKNMTIHMLLLKNEMQHIVGSVANLKNFYDFLNKLQADLAKYKSQKLKNDDRIVNVIKSCTSAMYKFVQDIKDLQNTVKEIGSDEIYQKIKTIQLNTFQLKHLKAVFDAFSSKLEFSCTSSSREVTVKGYNVKLSDVVEIERNCSLQAKNIQVFALNKIFIDKTIDKTGTEVQIFILAPTWEIIGGPKIILDGKAGEPHEQASANSAESVDAVESENGKNGLPGLPGGPAGHFFGVGKLFINSENLEIHANGGKGSAGQDGGNGADGIAGEELPELFMKMKLLPKETEEYFQKNHYNYTFDTVIGSQIASKVLNQETLKRLVTSYPVRSPVSDEVSHYSVVVFGKQAKKPTDGGDGGAGGRGGYPGKIVMNDLGNLVNVITSNNPGSTGSEGQGGYGGKKVVDGRTVKYDLHVENIRIGLPYLIADDSIHYDFLPSIKVTNIVWKDGAEVPAGKDGKPGGNKKDEVYPTKPTNIISPYLALNSFKYFVRMKLLNNIKESELRAFIHEVERDNQIKAYYNTLGFVNELEGLENQFFELRNTIDFVPFYDSLLTRIEEFAKSQKILENKKVLSFIYTAALTKVCTLKKKRTSEIVVDLKQYLSATETSVQNVNDAQHLKIVRTYQNDYEKTLINKIREANDLIKNKIEPEINEFWEASGKQIKSIVDEINEEKKAAEDAKTTFQKKIEEIRHTMQWRGILLPLKLATSFLSISGPVGAMVGVVTASSISIAEGMLLDTTSGQEQYKINSLVPNLKEINRVTEDLNKKPQKLAEKLEEIIVKLDEHKEELSFTQTENFDILETIKDLKTQVDEVKNRKANQISDIERRYEDAKMIKKKIYEFVNTRKNILETEETQLNAMKHESDKIIVKKRKLEKSLQRIKIVESVLNGVEIVADLINGLKNDEENIRNIEIVISEYEDELRNMEKLEDLVYDVVIPDLRQIEQTINGIKERLNGSSHAKLDFTKWTVQKTLRDVKSMLQKFTHKMSFELQNNQQRFIEQIAEAFSVLISIYDRIDSYSDSVKQAEYIAHIVSTPMTNVKVTNSELNDAMIDLKLILQSNILFEKYETALHAFKQHYFPFAAHILYTFQLPTGMRFKDIEVLRSNIIEEIKAMKNHIDESQAIIDKYSKLTHENKIFNSNTTGSSPFYVWKHDTVKDEVQQLLNGSEILIKADISKGLYYNSIKYTDIGINLKLKDENLQKKFTSVLKSFILTMVMVGNNYYRCGDRYYFMSVDDNINISYTLAQEETKNWIDPNSVYTKIRKSQPFLSPYGMWSIKLKGVDNSSVTFDDFKVFASESIDLELVGRGFYIEQNSHFNFEICDEYLNEFYNVENIAEEL